MIADVDCMSEWVCWNWEDGRCCFWKRNRDIYQPRKEKECVRQQDETEKASDWLIVTGESKERRE